jgi:hypothetical protein
MAESSWLIAHSRVESSLGVLGSEIIFLILVWGGKGKGEKKEGGKRREERGAGRGRQLSLWSPG